MDFSNNAIGQMGLTAMLQAMSSNDALETLVLHTNNLQDDGAEAIAQYMAGAANLPYHKIWSDCT